MGEGSTCNHAILRVLYHHSIFPQHRFCTILYSTPRTVPLWSLGVSIEKIVYSALLFLLPPPAVQLFTQSQVTWSHIRKCWHYKTPRPMCMCTIVQVSSNFLCSFQPLVHVLGYCFQFCCKPMFSSVLLVTVDGTIMKWKRMNFCTMESWFPHHWLCL